MKKILLLTILIINNFKIFPQDNDNEFVKVRESNFELYNKPYYFVGTNLWYGLYLGSSDENGKRERLIRELDKLQEIGINNLRVLGSSESSYLPNTLKPTVQNEDGIYNENLLEGLDFLLNEMNKRNMKAVIILNNYWEWSGGFAAYNKWTNFGKPVNPYNENESWSDFMDYSASFYLNKNGIEIFKQYIKYLLNRKNTFNSKYYFEDPTIMAWQLANEPRLGTINQKNIENQNIFYSWIEDISAYIKTIDKNHLVSIGSEGIIGCLQIDSIYIKSHEVKNIDYLTFHIWAKNWNWYDPKNAELTFESAKQQVKKYFDEHLTIAKKLGKPIVLEEFGLNRDNDDYNIEATTKYRDEYFNFIYEQITESIKQKLPIAGSNFWAWSGEGRAKDKNYKWEVGDNFTGDPPHEPQGLYSIFDSDYSTIEILKKHVNKLKELSN